MKNWVDLICFQFCVHCGEYVYQGENIFCYSCFRKLLDKTHKVSGLREIKSGYLHFYLFDWEKGDNSSLVHSLIYGIKGGRAQVTFNKLASQFALYHSKYGFKNPVFVPAPSKNHEVDHAGQWAMALAKVYGTQYFDLFDRSKDLEQKQKNRAERNKLKLKIKDNLPLGWESFLYKFSEIVFVDDILTTGATAKKAYEYLKMFGKTSCITVTYRL